MKNLIKKKIALLKLETRLIANYNIQDFFLLMRQETVENKKATFLKKGVHFAELNLAP